MGRLFREEALGVVFVEGDGILGFGIFYKFLVRSVNGFRERGLVCFFY